MTTMESRTMTVRIERPLSEVYEFLAEPANFARWAKGLDTGANVRFSERNAYGVADHSVFTPDGQEVYVPLRAIRNGTGAEVHLTLLRQPGMTDEMMERDAAAIERDLQALKRALEP